MTAGSRGGTTDKLNPLAILIMISVRKNMQSAAYPVVTLENSVTCQVPSATFRLIILLKIMINFVQFENRKVHVLSTQLTCRYRKFVSHLASRTQVGSKVTMTLLRLPEAHQNQGKHRLRKKFDLHSWYMGQLV